MFRMATLTRRSMLAGLVAGVAAATGSRLFAQQKPALTVFKDANCGCCQNWVNYMQGRGYRSAVTNANMPAIKVQYGVGQNLQSCHTTLVGGYIIEGHVPEGDIVRLLKEKPAGVVGLTIPGMPASAPGMDGRPFQPYTVLAFDKAGKTSVYARHTQPE